MLGRAKSVEIANISANDNNLEISEIFLLISLKIVTRAAKSVDLPPQITHTQELSYSSNNNSGIIKTG